MGTKQTMERKFEIAFRILNTCKEKEVNIDKENLISTFMVEMHCERRKAMEILKAAIIKFPYTEGKMEGKKAYIFQNDKSTSRSN